MIELSAGTRIGRYVCQRRLGSGGMGEVWQALLLGPGGFRKAVALKVLTPTVSDGDTRQALLHEAKLGARLSHPNIVSVYALEAAATRGRW